MSVSESWWEAQFAFNWEGLSGQNPQYAWQARGLRLVLFVCLLGAAYGNYRICSEVDTLPVRNEDGTNALWPIKLFFPSTSLLFYGEKDEWEDRFVGALLFTLALLSLFLGLCFQCWPLVVPMLVLIGALVLVAPVSLLVSVAKLVHVWKNPREMGEAWDFYLWSLIYMVVPTFFLILGAVLVSFGVHLEMQNSRRVRSNGTRTNGRLLEGWT
ncbi:hypothetical protein M3Y99_00908400 [Aphelenchoides fujianensis]|nr:hypothetical protein M3Y99_00908400 [Aphelenchoides fujianensis]